MTHALLPAIWLIVLIVGLPQLSETVYTPSLPDIAKSLRASESMVEHTLTIYLFGFAMGMLFWGKLSDKVGRKPCVLAGFFIFILGCIGCYCSTTITTLMLSRFVQAFGGSVGSVLGQAICRDAFHGPALGKVYSSVSGALAIFPAIGPVLGGFVAENAGWSSIFICLMLCAIALSFLVMWYLPETHHVDRSKPVATLEIALSLLRNKKAVSCGLIVAACNGISFSYFAEGPFYLIKLLGLSPTVYGLSFIAIAASTMLGGLLSTKLHNMRTSQSIMQWGIMIMLTSNLVLSGLVLWHTFITALPQLWLIGFTIASQMSTMFGFCIATSHALALALVDYKWCIGTASSLFGFFYCGFIALFTLGMGCLHNGTLLPMPLYFLGISVFMLLVQHSYLNKAI